MAMPPRFAAERWGWAIWGAYPESGQVSFHRDGAAEAETDAARAGWHAVRSQRGSAGPQGEPLPHGVWLCVEHGVAAVAHLHRGRTDGMAALRAALDGGA